MLSRMVCSISRVLSTSRCAAAASAFAVSSWRSRWRDLGDVAGDADHAARAAFGTAHHDAVLACPAPRSVPAAIAELDIEPRDFALVQRGDHPRVVRAVVGMHDLGECADRPEFRQVENFDQRRGEIDHAGVEIDVVGAGADADRIRSPARSAIPVGRSRAPSREIACAPPPARTAARNSRCLISVMSPAAPTRRTARPSGPRNAMPYWRHQRHVPSSVR